VDGADRTRTTTTASDGSYRLEGLTHGTFSVRASLATYVSDERRLTLNTEGVQDFRLTQADVQGVGGTLGVVLLPGHQWQFSGAVINLGDACALNVTGTMDLVSPQIQTTLPLTLDPAALAIGATRSFTACCLADKYTEGGHATLHLTFQSVPCG